MRKRNSSSLSLEEQKLLTRVMTMGAGTNLPVVMSPSELVRLIGVIFYDNNAGLELALDHPGLWEQINPQADYYDLPESWFLQNVQLAPEQHVALMKSGEALIDDFSTYLRCLSELHKRRRKYTMILSAQPLPKMIQVSPRALMEYGTTDPACLASWLTWRKFFYDLDNRSAQETGYLFEPILAAAIGGEQKSAKTKVITRTGDSSKGRQVDCWKVLPTGQKLAYEFKLRVTIAASGQGRFGEEIQFAVDAQNSAAKPILVVLDPTMNPRLSELQQAYKDRGGAAYLGDAAWQHLEEQAGDVMSKFIEKYVRKPIQDITRFEEELDSDGNQLRIELLDLHASLEENEIVLGLGKHIRRIPRREDITMDSDDESATDD